MLGGAVAGAGLFGFADAATVVGRSSLVITDSHQLLLMVLDSLCLGVVGGVLALPLLLWPSLRSAWAGLLWGLFMMAAAAMGEWWFTKPPDFLVEASSLRGNVLVFGLSLVGLGALCLVLCARVRAPRARVAMVLAVTFLLTFRSLSSGRDLPALGLLPTGAPNVLLITLDTSRADHFSAYGQDHARTPRFDQLASEGALVQTAIAQIPVTGPSHTTLLSGQPPWQHGALLNGIDVNRSVVMMAEHLREGGWRTAAFVSAYVLDGSLGFSRGFEIYDDDFSWLQGWSSTLPGRFMAAAERRFSPTHVLERRGGRTVDQAAEWLASASKNRRPFFAWVHLFDPHGPYTPPPPWDTAYYEGDPRDPAHTSMAQVGDVASYLKPTLDGITDLDWVLAQYAGEVSYTDDQIGRLLDLLDTLEVAEDTLVVVVGDHGESLTENGVWFDHGDDLFAPSMHVPMAFRLPGRIPAGTVVHGPVEVTDVARTIYDLLSVSPPPTAQRDGAGASLLDALQTGIFTGRAEARSMTFDRPVNLAERRAGRIDRPQYRMVALRRIGEYVYIYRDAPMADHAFYPLGPDDRAAAPEPLPFALQSLAGSAQGILDGMRAEDLQRSSTEPDAEMEAQLRALGYIE